MTYNEAFCKLFCVTLLATAIIFIVVLTDIVLNTETMRANRIYMPHMFIDTLINMSTTQEEISSKINKKLRNKAKGLIITNNNLVDLARMEQQSDTSEFKPLYTLNINTLGITTHNAINYSDEEKLLNVYLNTHKDNYSPNYYLDNILKKYIRNHRKPNNNEPCNMTKKSNTTYELKRLRRYASSHDDIKKNKKGKQNIKNNKDEMIIEIETHFDDKGMDRVKKKKFIQGLVKKILNAINSETKNNNKEKKIKHLKTTKKYKFHAIHKSVKFKDPKISSARFIVFQRQLAPVGTPITIQDSLSYSEENSGKNWKETSVDPYLTTLAKSINLVQTRNKEIDHDKIIKLHDVSHRLQQPLYSEGNDEFQSANTYLDFGNLQFLIQNIDGTGLSIGLNQYIDEAPDTESLKLFSRLEDFTENVNQNIIPIINSGYQGFKINKKISEKSHYVNKRHAEINKKSEKAMLYSNQKYKLQNKQQQDYHSNEYRMIFENENLFPYESYQEIYEKKTNTVFLNKEKIKKRKKSFVFDDRVLDENLKPSDIFTLANLIRRKKRSSKAKNLKFSENNNIETRLKTNILLIKNKIQKQIRNKRQIGKIRIITTDNLPDLPKASSQNIYVDDNLVPSRAVVRDFFSPEALDETEKEEHYDDFTHSLEEDFQTHSQLAGRVRQNVLMSKYPHIFSDEASKFKDSDNIPNSDLIFAKIVDTKLSQRDSVPTEGTFTVAAESSYSEIPQIIKEISAHSPNANYKFTFKIHPKNDTDMKTGYKEMHTSINKTFDKNGVIYHSLVNVSEWTKIENKSKTKIDQTFTNRPHFYNSNVISPGSFKKLIRSYSDSSVMTPQESFQKFLQTHKENIDKELNRLSRTKHDKTLFTEKVSSPKNHEEDELIDISLPLNPPQVIHLRKNEVNAYVLSAILNQKNLVPHVNLNETNTEKISTTFKTTQSSTTHATTTTYKSNYDNLTETICKVENITKEVLKKIDRNTKLLRIFLQKVIDKIQTTTSTSHVGYVFSSTETANTINNQTPVSKQDNLSRYWKRYDRPKLNSFITDSMEKLDGLINNTHYSIPFFYAYQQPPLSNMKNFNPITNVVYHGHIHAHSLPNERFNNTNHLSNDPISQNISNFKSYVEAQSRKTPSNIINVTKFFMDDFDTDYKIIDAIHNIKEDFKPNSVFKQTNTTHS